MNIFNLGTKVCGRLRIEMKKSQIMIFNCIKINTVLLNSNDFDLEISVAEISCVNKVFFILILTPCQERLKQSLSMR